MARCLSAAVLLAFLCGLPLAHLCAVESKPIGEAVMALDVCGPDEPAAGGETPTLAEPSFAVPAIFPVSDISKEDLPIYVSRCFSQIDRPPIS